MATRVFTFIARLPPCGLLNLEGAETLWQAPCNWPTSMEMRHELNVIWPLNQCGVIVLQQVEIAL